MKISKILMVAVTALFFAGGSAFYVNSSFAGNAGCDASQDVASTCGRCGDGYCNPRCGENAKNCPRDCGGFPESK